MEMDLKVCTFQQKFQLSKCLVQISMETSFLVERVLLKWNFLLTLEMCLEDTLPDPEDTSKLGIRLEKEERPRNTNVLLWRWLRNCWIDNFRITGWSLPNGSKMLCGDSFRVTPSFCTYPLLTGTIKKLFFCPWYHSRPCVVFPREKISGWRRKIGDPYGGSLSLFGLHSNRTTDSQPRSNYYRNLQMYYSEFHQWLIHFNYPTQVGCTVTVHPIL